MSAFETSTKSSLGRTRAKHRLDTEHQVGFELRRWPQVHQAVTVSYPPCILLAEDDEQLRRVVAAALNRHGYEVVECANGEELIEHLDYFSHPMASEDFDLIISDIRMPGANGLDVLESLERSDRYPPTILITAFGDAETHAEAHRLGAIGVIDKPFEISELLEKVDEILF